MASKAQALAAARRRWGKKASVYVDPRAPAPARRVELIAEARQRQARLKEIRLERKALCQHHVHLREAARFVVDVAGDPPSIEQLARAVETSERDRDLADEAAELQRDSKTFAAHRRRCNIVVDRGWATEFVASGDTWEEVLEKIGGKPEIRKINVQGEPA